MSQFHVDWVPSLNLGYDRANNNNGAENSARTTRALSRKQKHDEMESTSSHDEVQVTADSDETVATVTTSVQVYRTSRWKQNIQGSFLVIFLMRVSS